jgi:hypothetical protein
MLKIKMFAACATEYGLTKAQIIMEVPEVRSSFLTTALLGLPHPLLYSSYTDPCVFSSR